MNVCSGLIGRSWSMLFTGAGYHVYLYDVTEELVKKAIEDIGQQLEVLEHSGMLRGQLNAAEQLKLVSSTTFCFISYLASFIMSLNFRCQNCERMCRRSVLYSRMCARITASKTKGVSRDR